MTARLEASAIVAVKDGERFLAQALASIAAQDRPAAEVIVVDGGSTDGTEAIARSFPGVRWVPQRGRGIADAYNLGVEEARGDLVAFLSHDDLWTPDKLALQAGRLETAPDLAFVVAHARFFLEPGCAPPPGFRRELLDAERPAWIVETLVARRSLFGRIGGFDPRLAVAEDVDWFARAADAGVPSAILPRVLLRKRVHDRNASLAPTDPGLHDLLEAVRRSIARKRAGRAE